MGIMDNLLNRADEKPLADSAIKPFLNSISISRERLFVETVLYSGVNPMDLAELRWSDIDFRASSIALFNRRKKRTYTVYLPQRILSEYRGLKLENGYPVFGYSEYMQKSLIERHTKAFFGNQKSWHSIRLTYPLNAKKAGERLEVVASNMAVSADSLMRYWSPSPDDMRRSAELIK